MSTRITGLASGMDIDGLVKQMMRPTQIRIDRVLQQRTKSEWTQDAFNDINATLAKFVLDRRLDFGLTATSGTGTTYGRSADSMTWLKRAASSDAEVLTATASAGAVEGTVRVKVERLASNWSSASAASLPALGTNADGSTKANNLVNQFGLSDDAVIDFTVATAKGKIRITNAASAQPEEGVKLIKVDPEVASLTALAAQFNGAGIGLKASYDAGIRRFFLQTADSGSASTLQITDNSSGLGTGVDGFLAAKNGGTSLLQLADSAGKVKHGEAYAGVDALLDIGAAVGVTQSSNDFTVNGISLSLHKLGEATVQVAPDVDGAYNKIKSFVDEYNQLIEGLNEKLSEQYDRDYAPLTDEQKESMTEDQIKKWEERAKTGLLSDSQELSTMLSRLRIGMVSAVKGTDGGPASLAAIGIGTQPYSTDGKLVIDEKTLRNALSSDADGVMQLLFKTPDASVTDTTGQQQQSGIVTRLFSNVVDGMKSIIKKAGTGENANLYRSVQATILLEFVTQQSSQSVIDKDLLGYKTALATLNTRFAATQTRYYNQFTAMEQAIERANNQSAWLSQQFASSSS